MSQSKPFVSHTDSEYHTLLAKMLKDAPGTNTTNDTEKRCGTCRFFVFGMRSYCGWRRQPGTKRLSAAYKAGGEGHAMWIDDGEDCRTWEAKT